MSKFVFLGALLILSSSSLISQSSTQRKPAVSEEQDYAFAYGLYRDSLFQLASKEFQEFSIKYPNSLKLQEALFLHIECLFQSAQYEPAVKKYNEFILKYPSSRYVPEAYCKIGQSYIRGKKYPEAVKALKIVLDQYGGHEKAGEAAYWIGEAYFHAEDYLNALKYYTLSYENYPKNRFRDYALYSVAWTYQKRKEYSAAVEWYKKLTAEFPKSPLTPGAYVHIGECYYSAKDYTRAVDVLMQSRVDIRTEEELGNADYLIAEAFYKMGENEKAQKQYEKFLSEHPGHSLAGEVEYNLGWSILQQKKYTKAYEIFDRLSGRKDDIGHASLYRRSAVERWMGKPDKALQTLNEVIERDPKGNWSDNARFDIGMVFFNENNFENAKKNFVQMVTEYPKSEILADAYKMLGENALGEGKLKDAQFWFERALAVPSASIDVKGDAGFQSAVCLLRLKKYKDAAVQFSSFVQQYPKHPKTNEAVFYRAEAEYHLGNYTISGQLYKEAADDAGAVKKEESLYGIAWSFFKQEKFSQALEAFESLLKSYPKGKFALDARTRLGDSYFYLNDYKKAVVLFRSVLRMYPGNAAIDYAYYQLGQSYFKSGDAPDAMQTFDGLIKTLPKSPLADDAQFARGWINFQRKEYKEAIKEFGILIEKYPGSELLPRTYYTIGDSYYNLRQYTPAEKSYREVLNRFPKSKYVIDAATGIQYCYAAQGKEGDAVRVLDEFMKANPESGLAEDILLKKGELLIGQQKYSEAAGVFRKFIDQYPQSAQRAAAQFSLAQCYQAGGRFDEAAAAFLLAAQNAQSSEKIIGESLFEASEIYSTQNNTSRAMSILGMVPEKVKDREICAEAEVRKGRILLKTGKTNEAALQFDRVLQAFHDTKSADEARMARARMYVQAGDFDKAKKAAEIVAGSHTDELGAEAQYIIGVSLAGKKDWNNVITALLKLKYVFPAYERWVGRANLGLGDAYEQTKDMKRARESYQSVLKMKTDTTVIEEAKRRLKKMGQGE